MSDKTCPVCGCMRHSPECCVGQSLRQSELSAHGSVFRSDSGKEFRFNDHVCIEMLMGVPDEKRTGRLVQVRKGCGQFGSCVFMLRLRDGSLAAFENAMMRHASDKRFEDAFYRSNGRQPEALPIERQRE